MTARNTSVVFRFVVKISLWI